MIHRARFRHCLGWAITFLLLLPGHAWALGWQFEVADRSDSVYTSLALDSQGRPHISAFDVPNQRLKYVRFDGQVWRSEVVDGNYPNSAAGASSALTLDLSDRPHISYRFEPLDGTSHLRYARFDGIAWRIETIETLDTLGGGYTSIALDPQGRPHVSYCDCLNGLTKYARFDGVSWRVETVDTGTIGHTSLKLDAQGRPHISYSGRQRLRYARWDGVAWRVETVDDLGQFGFVEHTSLVLDADGRPHVAYASTGGLRYARWDGSAWRIEVVIRPGGTYVSLGLDSGRHPLISYYDAWIDAGALRLARFDGLGWQIDVVESGGLGMHTSLKVDSQDRVHLSYNAESQFALKYARGEPGVRLDLQLNQPSFRSGETLVLSATVAPGSVPLTADAYVAVGLPDGALLFMQGDGGFTAEVLPLVRNWSVTSFTGEIFRYTLGGSEPAGAYTWFAAFTAPGTLTLIESLVSAPFTFTP